MGETSCWIPREWCFPSNRNIEKLAMGGAIGKIEAVIRVALLPTKTRKGMKKTEVMVNGDGSVANLVAK